MYSRGAAPYVDDAAHSCLSAAAGKGHDMELEPKTISVPLELLTIYGLQGEHFLLRGTVLVHACLREMPQHPQGRILLAHESIPWPLLTGPPPSSVHPSSCPS